MVPFDPAVKLVLAGIVAVLIAGPAARAEYAPGDFDFYVLALSWSPTYCALEGADRVSGAAVESILDITPSAGLIRYQWRKHGLCTGLRQRDYFTLMREAFATVSIPEAYADPSDDASLAPASIEAAFLDANPGLPPRGIAVTCKQGQLADIRICLTKDLEFRECREVDGDACRASRIAVPAVR
jgi:ribonuclease T2